MVEEICELESETCSLENIKHVGLQLKALNLMFCRHMEANIREIGFEGMSVVNVWIIEYLARNEDGIIFQKDIERKFKIGKSSLAGTLKVMEEKGVIVRKTVEGDARLKRVSLTDKGKEYACKMEQGKEYMEKKVTNGISEEDMKHFFEIVRRMQENLTE